MSIQSTGLSRSEKRRRAKPATNPTEGVPPSVLNPDLAKKKKRDAATEPRKLRPPGGLPQKPRGLSHPRESNKQLPPSRGPPQETPPLEDFTLPDGVVRLVFKAELLERLGISFPTLWKWMREGTFPRARQCGGKSCWLSNEVDEWIAALPVRRLKGDGV